MPRKSKKILVSVLATLTGVAMLVAGCGGSQKQAASQTDKKIIIKAAHGLATEHPFHIGMDAFAKSVAAKTNGKVEVQVFPNGQLGSDERQLAESLQLGNIQATVVASGAVASFTPKVDIFNLPFLYRDLQHMYKVCDGEPGRIVAKDLEGKGLKVLAWFNGLPRNIFNNKKPITKIEDLKGMKIRVMQSPVQIGTFNSIGALATPMPAGEVYSALQQGVIDGAENNPFSILGYKYYEVSKYYSLTQHFYEASPLMMDKKFFNAQTPEIQKALLEAAAEARDTMRKYMEQKNDEALQEIAKKGTVVNKVDDMTPFQKAVEPVYKQFEDKIGKDLIEMVKNTK